MPELHSESSASDFETSLQIALSQANVPTLQLLLVQLTGDQRWLAAPYLPVRPQGIDDDDSGGLASEHQAAVRSAAYEAILAWRAGTPVAIPAPSAEQLIAMMSVCVGEQIPDAYGAMMEHRLQAFNRVAPPTVTHGVPAGFRALIVGAGMSGIAAAVKLKEAGIPYVIVDKGDDVSGVWQQNKYPACGVDTPSHLYSYTFAQGDWSYFFARKDEISSYFRKVAEKFGILDDVRLRTEVTAARYDEDQHRWVCDLYGPDGNVERLEANILFTAVGAFGTPKLPDIEGLHDFEGELQHTALWDESIDLRDKRVGVIGTGASAMQLVPAIVDEVADLTIFQRSKQWATPFPKFRVPIADPLRFLFSELPMYEWWYRLRLAWIFDSRIYDSLKIDPEWQHPDRSINAKNEADRTFLENYIREQLGDRQDLIPRVIPEFPPWGKRMLLDNGWFRTLTRDDVELEDAKIVRIDKTGIEVEGGRHHDFDVIVAASGFDVGRFLGPVPVYGRDEISIREAWGDDDPQAYLGSVIPRFPNLFMLYGPNTAFGHGGSFMYIIECQIDYALSVLDKMFESGITEVECRQDVCDRYNDKMQEMHKGMIWAHPATGTYYRNAKGRVIVNNPWRTADFWTMTHSPNLDDYEVKTASDQPVRVG